MFEKLLLGLMMIIAPYGSWDSPITSEIISSGSIGLYEMQASSNGIYWTELHPKEKGRYALMFFDGKTIKEMLPKQSVRSRVHEYGGGAFCIDHTHLIYCNDEDRQLYTLEGKQLTHEPNMRFADGCGPIWVGEIHEQEIENCLVWIDDHGFEKIAFGHDFYSSPRLSPDGKQLAFITWDFPNMQWDSSTLWIAEIDENHQLHHLHPVAGGENESVCGVRWSSDGVLHFVSDKTGFWNIYRFAEGALENLCEMDAEFGLPGWIFGQSTYAFTQDGKIVCSYVVKGVDHLGIIDPKTKQLIPLDLPFTRINNVISWKEKICFFAASPTQPFSLIVYDLKTSEYKILKQSFSVPISEEWISKAEVIEYPSLNGKTGYGFYYPPKNPKYQAPNGEKPPAIIRCHGGPTARSSNYLMLDVQYWTTRGFAFVDVNYGGSTGYGREYFKRLEGNWGVLDVHDAISAAKTLVARGLADPSRLLIRGGSAGGYTALAALAFHHFFAAGTSYYGISDLELLYESDHKFESKYTDRLVGTYPEEVELIRKRSPIYSIEKFSAPILLFQGEEDKVVPPDQANKIYQALVAKGIPTALLIFEGEGHGFRRAENIQQALDAELYFYSQILGIPLAKPFSQPPVEIKGLKGPI